MSRPSTGALFVRRGTATVLSLLGLTVLGACSGSSATPDRTAAPSTTRTSAPAIESPVAPPTRPQAQIPAANEIVEQPALRKTIRITGCSAASGGWKATGTARNPSGGAQTYHLLVFFTDRYSRVIDYARTSVPVAAGADASWTATARFDPPSGTHCVLRGLYAGTRPSTH